MHMPLVSGALLLHNKNFFTPSELISIYQDSTRELYNDICELAIADDKLLLDKLVRSGVCLDVQYKHFTPVTELAKKGKDTAVNLLIHNYDCSIKNALFGYALAKRHDKVVELLKLGVPTDYALQGYAWSAASDPDSIDHKYVRQFLYSAHSIELATIAYAANGNTREVNALFAKNASKLAAITGYARAYHYQQDQQVQALLKENTNDFKLLWEAMYAYAEAGNYGTVKELLANNPKDELELQIAAMLGFAAGGFYLEANCIWIRHSQAYDKTFTEQLKYSLLLVKNYARCGHSIWVNSFLDDNFQCKKLINMALLGYCMGGHHNFARNLIKVNKADPEYAIVGYVYNQDHNKVEEYLSKNLKSINAAISAYHISEQLNNPENILRILSHFNNKKIRTALRKSMKENPIFHDVDEILQQANKINHLMYSRALTYELAIIWENVQEIMILGRLKKFTVEICLNIIKFLIPLSTYEKNILLNRIFHEEVHVAPVLRVLKNSWKNSIFAEKDRIKKVAVQCLRTDSLSDLQHIFADKENKKLKDKLLTKNLLLFFQPKSVTHKNNPPQITKKFIP